MAALHRTGRAWGLVWCGRGAGSILSCFFGRAWICRGERQLAAVLKAVDPPSATETKYTDRDARQLCSFQPKTCGKPYALFSCFSSSVATYTKSTI